MFLVIISSAQILTMADGIIKLIIAEDHAGLRETLVAVFSSFSKEIVVIAAAENGKELIEKVESNSPDIVLTDIQMPLIDGIEATRIIKAKRPNIGIIAFSMLDDAFSLEDMIAAGAQGYLLKSADKEELVMALDSLSSLFIEGAKACTLIGFCKKSATPMPVDDDCLIKPWIKADLPQLCPYASFWVLYDFNKIRKLLE